MQEQQSTRSRNAAVDFLTDILVVGEYQEYLAQKHEVMKIDFEIKKRSFFEKVIGIKRKKFKVLTTLISVSNKVIPYMRMLNGPNDIELILYIVSSLIINKSNISGKKIEHLKSFLFKNLDISELLVLFEILINHSGCYFLKYEYNNIYKK